MDPQRHLLVVGIIDYLRQWDWVKQGELTIKAAAAIVTNVEPTVQPPKKYAQRLLNCARRCFAQFAPQRALSQVPLLPPLHVLRLLLLAEVLLRWLLLLALLARASAQRRRRTLGCPTASTW